MIALLIPPGRRSGAFATDFVRKFFIFANGEPVLAGIAGAAFQGKVQLFDQSFGDGLLGIPDDHINAFEVIGRFDYIIHIDNTVPYANGIGFIDIPCLVMGQTAAFNVV